MNRLGLLSAVLGAILVSTLAFGQFGGNIASLACGAHNWVSAFTGGSGTCTQPASTDLSDVTAATTWTPADGSGQSLVFTSVSARYRKMAGWVDGEFAVTFPSTASSANATISGLPVATANVGAVLAPGACKNSVGSFSAIFVPAQNATTGQIINPATNLNITDANLSLNTIQCSFSYATQ